LFERSCRMGETLLGLADQTGECLLPTSECGEGSALLVLAKAQPVSRLLVRGGLLHEGPELWLGQRLQPSWCLLIRPVCLTRWRALVEGRRTVEPDGGGGLVDPGAGDGIGHDVGGRAFV